MWGDMGTIGWVFRQRLVIVLLNEQSKKRTAIRNTEIPGLFNFTVGGALLNNIDEVTASQDAVRAFLRNQTSNRSDITFGEVVCYSPYKYVNYASENSSKLNNAWCRVNIRMVNKFGKGRVFIAGGRLYHDLSISFLTYYLSFKMQRMSTCSQEVR